MPSLTQALKLGLAKQDLKTNKQNYTFTTFKVSNLFANIEVSPQADNCSFKALREITSIQNNV